MASTVIVGCGVVGVTTAYYLSEHQPGDSIHLVEAADALFASASGFAGGFLARDWFTPEVAALAALSFDQHGVLAAQYGGHKEWGFAPSTALRYRLPIDKKKSNDDKGGDAQAQGGGEDWLQQGSSRSTAAVAMDDGDNNNNNDNNDNNNNKKNKDKHNKNKDKNKNKGPVWLRRREGDDVHVVADDGTTAQVDPLQFCQFLLRVCRDRGVHLHQPARVLAVGTDDDGVLASVELETGSSTAVTTTTTTTLPCTRVILAAGAWTPRVFERLFGGPPNSVVRSTLPIHNVAGYSLVVRPVGLVPPAVAEPAAAAAVAEDNLATACHAVFVNSRTLGYAPEVFSRVNGTLYMAGLNSQELPLPEMPTDEVPAPAQLAELLATCKMVLGIAEKKAEEEKAEEETMDHSVETPSLEIIRKGLCHRPVTPWGRPIVVRLGDERLQRGTSSSSSTGGGCNRNRIRTRPGAGGGVFVASGHGPWGISMGPGTGMVLAELAQERPLSADISGLGLA
ncbi:FAD dependent oxidoreductase [Niveomyces insectorum RCEF 264]|uniref:FAD dependent oxidoreductase n=1 Tax=Niveomyces insectorum RCEF 264 TaxID=1081102 RepID=A0A167TFT6_9HYPO|nr:FAD dependent oxidoreductase [Niveomyces insectorum RCEF 264]